MAPTVPFLALLVALAANPRFEDPFADEKLEAKVEKVEQAARKRGEVSSTRAAFADDTAEDIWVASCAMCHAKNGAAKTYMGRRDKVKNLTDPLWQKSVSDEALSEVIRHGVADTKMKGFEKKMSKAQLDALVKWVRTLAAK